MQTHGKTVVTAVLVLLVALVLLSEPAHRAVVNGLAEAERIASARPVAAMLLIVGLSALAAMLAFVSSWVLVPFAVFTWGPAGALALLWTGWLLGGAASYTLGRALGRPALRWLVPERLLARYEDRFGRRMPFHVVLLVQLSLPSEIPGYLLGVVRYSFFRYLAALGIIELVYGVVTVYLGQGVLERRVVPILAGLTALAALTLWAAFRLRSRFAQTARFT